MENRSHALVAGLFVIFLSISVTVITMWFNGNTLQRSNYLVVTNESVTGLNSQAAVHYRGVNIGKVESISFDSENLHQILINISVDQNIKLTKSVYAQLNYQGVTGLAYMQLNDDRTESEPIQSDTRIPMRRSLLEEVAGFGQDLLSNTNELVRKMHVLLSDQNQTQISHILQNVEKATKRFDSIANNLPPMLRSFSELTNETNTLVKNLNELSFQANHVATKMNQRGGVIDSLSQSTEELSITIPELRKVSKHITRNSHNLDRTLRQLEQNPQSLLFGRSTPRPGPGEDGFISPIGAAQ